MKKPITVRMDLSKFNEVGNEVRWNVALLAKLRQAGIPATGRITLQGVEHGTLAYTTDKLFGDAVYSWTPDEPEDDEEEL